MEKDFVEYLEALALKELGFNEKCLAGYNKELLTDDGRVLNNIFIMYGGSVNYNIGDEVISAPLKSQAFRWFREKYNLVFNFISYNIVKPREYHWSITWNDEAKATGIVKTYEEAELACLKKLIEIVKEK